MKIDFLIDKRLEQVVYKANYLLYNNNIRDKEFFALGYFKEQKQKVVIR